ncbi:polysaccharide pyruvyl transferase family protein [Vibrio coralliilyticus]|uniref:polysaccharide pyruvyl transferase family protein n=1 Tax=Vibrio coralliilyticus TaxID=190893 RepID=UPI001561AAB3|nr:polysaccharide pyruvyl transferase family protein [Vibrio coralliilyticus]NRF27190.1 polysaccharide pyruvyl transferase family protein [Vibrio coralliilyticus]NRF81460.1 polysaccharide pyruvyl transferase family protein [Vibrio coralliilyticus]
MATRIAILTLHWSNNYGAVLQVYALSKFLINHGYEVEVLDYKMEGSRKSKILLHPIAFLRKMWGRRMFKPSKILARIGDKQTCDSVLVNKKSIFDDFRSKHLNITSDSYSAEMLAKDCPDFDIFIVGSDQVWAADFLFTSPTYLLSFVPEGKRKISYAASFGKRTLEGYLKPVFRKYINNLDYVSVREKSGLSIVSEYTDSVSQVLDPTLLLDNYDEIVSEPCDENYILVYKLNQEPILSDYFLSQVENISSITGYKVIFVSPDGSVDIPHVDLRLPSPNELLGLIKNAKIVLTNSFHGLVFSIIFQKPFLGFQRDLFKDKQNLRLTGLLSICDVSENLITYGTEINASNLGELLNIDYGKVNTSLAKEKKRSLSFLTHSLES